jgi:hypothetical protein
MCPAGPASLKQSVSDLVYDLKFICSSGFHSSVKWLLHAAREVRFPSGTASSQATVGLGQSIVQKYWQFYSSGSNG